MNICTYSYEEYLHLVKSFHGTLGLLMIGGLKSIKREASAGRRIFDAVRNPGLLA